MRLGRRLGGGAPLRALRLDRLGVGRAVLGRYLRRGPKRRVRLLRGIGPLRGRGPRPCRLLGALGLGVAAAAALAARRGAVEGGRLEAAPSDLGLAGEPLGGVPERADEVLEALPDRPPRRRGARPPPRTWRSARRSAPRSGVGARRPVHPLAGGHGRGSARPPREPPPAAVQPRARPRRGSSRPAGRSRARSRDLAPPMRTRSPAAEDFPRRSWGKPPLGENDRSTISRTSRPRPPNPHPGAPVADPPPSAWDLRPPLTKPGPDCHEPRSQAGPGGFDSDTRHAARPPPPKPPRAATGPGLRRGREGSTGHSAQPPALIQAGPRRAPNRDLRAGR